MIFYSLVDNFLITLRHLRSNSRMIFTFSLELILSLSILANLQIFVTTERNNLVKNFFYADKQTFSFGN
jgi:hypothetical protein